MERRRYTDEQLAAAHAEATSMHDLCRRLGISSGGRSSAVVARNLTRLGLSRPAPAVRCSYDPGVLASAAATSFTIAEVVRKIGAKEAGGTQAHIGRRLKQLGIDTSHFTGQAHARGRPSPARRRPEQVLVVLPEGSRRPAAEVLRRALLAGRRPYRCEGCGCDGNWQGRELRLHVDHVNGDWLDNRAGNLRFLCPNCHAQTATFGRRPRSASPTGSDA